MRHHACGLMAGLFRRPRRSIPRAVPGSGSSRGSCVRPAGGRLWTRPRRRRSPSVRRDSCDGKNPPGSWCGVRFLCGCVIFSVSHDHVSPIPLERIRGQVPNSTIVASGRPFGRHGSQTRGAMFSWMQGQGTQKAGIHTCGEAVAWMSAFIGTCPQRSTRNSDASHGAAFLTCGK